jgi:cobalt-zinc-cadmium resistance protein CzcA
MAWTVAFALLGALLFSMILAPVLASFVFRKGITEWHNPIMSALIRFYRATLGWAIRWRWITVAVAVLSMAGAYGLSRVIGWSFSRISMKAPFGFGVL